ncbi:MAG TPA: TIGR02444 family protein [Xanthobacteraceae bacterium]|jgi:uncharacterized protein (TIGR02444 family)
MSTAEPRSQSQGSPFWRFSLRFYREPDVAEACIRLQEEAGVDVNLLLFVLWHATHKRALSATEVAELERRIGAWRDATVVPLRALRRALKSPPALVAPAAAELFRTRIKAVELEAERLQQEAMYEFVRAAPWGRAAASPAAAARANISAYEAIAGAAFPGPAVETLLAALRRLELTTEE